MAILSLADFDEVEVQCPDLYGVSTHLRILKIAYYLTLHPDLSVQQIDDLHITDTGENHVMYEIRHRDIDGLFFLIKNKASSELLLKDYKSFDYIVTSDCDQKYIDQIMNYLRNLNEVSICFAIEDIPEKDKVKFEQLL